MPTVPNVVYTLEKKMKLYCIFKIEPNPDDPYLDQKTLECIFTDYEKALDFVSKSQDVFIEEMETR